MKPEVDQLAEPVCRRRSATALRDELAAAAAALEEALAQGDLAIFYQTFRATGLPFLLARHGEDAAELFRACFEVLHALGGVSPAVALAVENHYYVSSAIATFPSAGWPALDRRRRALLSAILDGRLLVANTNSKVHGSQLGEIGTCARREGDRFRITGQASYTSLATQGDLLVFITRVEGEGPSIFAIAPMQGNPAIEIGPYLFPSAMLDSDTRRITFRDLLLPEESLVASGNDLWTGHLFLFEMAWHQLLIPALYLGAAARAIEEVRSFLRGISGRDGRPLAELDGMQIDVGRLAIDYSAAWCVVQQGGEALGRVRRLPRDAELLERAVDLAGTAKYVGTRCAEEVVTAARRIVGARAFAGGHRLERLSQEVMFAALGPEVGAVIERRHGRRVLEADRFTGVTDPRATELFGVG